MELVTAMDLSLTAIISLLISYIVAKLVSLATTNIKLHSLQPPTGSSTIHGSNTSN
jgi:hypothetical protein